MIIEMIDALDDTGYKRYACNFIVKK